MKIISFIRCKKSIIEKIRIVFYRSKKIIYKYKTRLVVNGKKIRCLTELNNNIYFLDEILMKESDIHRDKIVDEAMSTYNGYYRSISGRKIKIDKVDWNCDYIFNYKWESKHFSKYILKDKNVSTDVKHVWELSRFYHLPILAQAYLITKDEKFCDKIISDILSWEDQNPINYTVNWTVSMEASIRIVNIIQSISLIRNSLKLHNNIIKLNNLIYKHGIYILNNLEKGLNTNNHYLSNLVGLIWIGIYFKDTKDKKLRLMSKKMLKFSIKQLKYELKYQIYNDGFSYEDSISYHGLNTEMMLMTITILEKNKVKFPSIIKDTTHKMVKSLISIMYDNGDIPVIGDLDNGRLMIFNFNSLVNKLNFKYLIRIANNLQIFVKRDIFLSPIIFKDSGIYRIFNNGLDVIVKCGKIGLNGLGGHAHNDQLSFILSVKNENFLIDSGTGYYSGDYSLRYDLRSTASHNTFCIDGVEQNDISKDLFVMQGRTRAKTLYIGNNKFEGQHFGYYDNFGVVYNRKIDVNLDSVVVLDSINIFPNKICYINYILDTDVFVKFLNKSNVLLIKKGIFIKLSVDGGYIEIHDQIISKSYSEKEISCKIKVIFNRRYVKTTFSVRKG